MHGSLFRTHCTQCGDIEKNRTVIHQFVKDFAYSVVNLTFVIFDEEVIYQSAFLEKQSAAWIGFSFFYLQMCDQEPGKSKLQTNQSPNVSSSSTILNGINNNNHNKMGSIQQSSAQLSLQYDFEKGDINLTSNKLDVMMLHI
jgi:hypothetical protein